jgi:hypothetical protein
VSEIPYSPCLWCSTVLWLIARFGPIDFSQALSPIGWIEWFVSLFGGRPKLGPDSATDNAALSLFGAVNPAWRAYGVGLRALENQGVAISQSSGYGRQLLDELTAQLSLDLQSQFGTQYRPYFDRGIAFLFSRNCTNAPCTAFRNDPEYRRFVSAGWIDQDGRATATNPYVAHPKAPPPPPPPPSQAAYSYRRSVVLSLWESVNRARVALGLARDPAPPACARTAACMDVMLGQAQTLTAELKQLTARKPPPAPPPESALQKILSIVAQLEKWLLWLEVRACLEAPEPELAIACLELLVVQRTVGLFVKSLIKELIGLVAAHPHLWPEIRRRKKTMACVNSHRETVVSQGPGPCCAALARSGQKAAIGVRVSATTKKGKCFVCEIAASKSQKTPGKLVFKRGKACENGVCLCPVSTGGCCELAAA